MTAPVGFDEDVHTADRLPSSSAMMVHQSEVRSLPTPAEIAAVMKERDDAELMQSIMGEVISAWFYEFKIGDKTVEGLGVTGAMEFTRLRAEQGFPIRFPINAMQIVQAERNEEKGIQATIIARDIRTGGEGLGVAFYPYYTWVTKNRGKPNETRSRVYDDKADRKAVSVAKRNAVIDLIPEAQIIALLRVRKDLAKANETRQDKEREIARLSALSQAAPIVTSSEPSKRGSAAVGDPYEPPARRQAPDGASEEQIEELLDLIESPAIGKEVVDKVRSRLKRGMPASLAATWIDQIKLAIKAAQPEGEDDDDLPLPAKPAAVDGLAENEARAAKVNL